MQSAQSLISMVLDFTINLWYDDEHFVNSSTDATQSLTYAQKQSSLEQYECRGNPTHDKYAGRKADSQAKERATRGRGDNLSNCASFTNIGNAGAHRSALLCVRGLPASTTENMLKLLFEQFAGFKSVTLPTNSVGTALVQFKQADHAAVALNGLQGFKLNPTHTLSLSYSQGSQIEQSCHATYDDEIQFEESRKGMKRRKSCHVS